MAIFSLHADVLARAAGRTAGGYDQYICPPENSQAARRVQSAGAQNMPTWAATAPRIFWLAADRYERQNACVGRTVMMALPAELDSAAHQKLVGDFLAATAPLAPASWAIHAEPDTGHNPHCHIIFSERDRDSGGGERPPEQYFHRANPTNPEAGGARKNPAYKSKAWLLAARATWAGLVNSTLTAEAPTVEKISEKSLAAQGIDREPGRHIGAWAARPIKAARATLAQVEREAADRQNSLAAAAAQVEADLAAAQAAADKIWATLPLWRREIEWWSATLAAANEAEKAASQAAAFGIHKDASEVAKEAEDWGLKVLDQADIFEAQRAAAERGKATAMKDLIASQGALNSARAAAAQATAAAARAVKIAAKTAATAAAAKAKIRDYDRDKFEPGGKFFTTDPGGLISKDFGLCREARDFVATRTVARSAADDAKIEKKNASVAATDEAKAREKVSSAEAKIARAEASITATEEPLSWLTPAKNQAETWLQNRTRKMTMMERFIRLGAEAHRLAELAKYAPPERKHLPAAEKKSREKM